MRRPCTEAAALMVRVKASMQCYYHQQPLHSGILGVAIEGGEVAGNYFTGCVGSMFAGGGHIHDNVFEHNPNGSLSADGLFERTSSDITRLGQVQTPATTIDLIYVGGVFLHNLVHGNYNQFLLQLYPESGPPTPRPPSSRRTPLQGNTVRLTPHLPIHKAAITRHRERSAHLRSPCPLRHRYL